MRKLEQSLGECKWGDVACKSILIRPQSEVCISLWHVFGKGELHARFLYGCELCRQLPLIQLDGRPQSFQQESIHRLSQGRNHSDQSGSFVLRLVRRTEFGLRKSQLEFGKTGLLKPLVQPFQSRIPTQSLLRFDVWPERSTLHDEPKRLSVSAKIYG